jgi:3',5'-cyclic AMP phosphodiesterase CpdA
MTHQISRREALRITTLAAAAAALSSSPLARAASSGGLLARPERKRVLRIAHLTDIHVQPELHADKGMAACLRHVRDLTDKPDVIFTGGDHVFDSFAQKEPRARALWDLWTRTLKDECGIPVESCIGNHDVWGVAKSKSQATGAEPLYAKAWAMDQLRIASPYRSFDRAGWHFIFLDSVFPNAESYLAKLDDQQFEWLAGDLAAVKPGTPTMIVSHIPIFSVAVLDFGKRDETKPTQVDQSLMHTDATRLHNLFLKHAALKVCVSGHLHLIDRVDFDGVTYLCNGAVCGNWWKGRHKQCDEGYALLNLYDDGSFEREYVAYGWKADPPPAKKPAGDKPAEKPAATKS